MKKATILGLTTAISVGLAMCAGSVNSSPKVTTDWSKLEPDMNILLTKVPMPPSVGDTLIDGAGGKSDCHLMSISSNNDKRTVTTWTCWGEKDHAFPTAPTRWSEVKLVASMNIYKDPTPQSVENTLTDSASRQYDCHATNYLKNDRGGSVSQWTCWSKKVFK